MATRGTDSTTRSNRSSTGSRLGRVAVATGVLGGAIAVAGGYPASAQEEPPRCIDAILSVDTSTFVDLDDWAGFFDGFGCVGHFGTGKLVINVLDKATGFPVDGTVDIAKLLNAFQFGYVGYAYGSPQASRLDPYCDLRWTKNSFTDEDRARIGADLAFDPATPLLLQPPPAGTIPFGGRPLRLLNAFAPVPPIPLNGEGLSGPLQSNQIAFSWACDANYDTLTTPAIADVGGGYELLAGRNTGPDAVGGTSDFRFPGGGTPGGLTVSNGDPIRWNQINLYVSKRPVVVETTTTTTTTTTVPAPPTTQAAVVLPPGPPSDILPETGRESGPFALLAAFLLAIGTVAIGVSRRRPASR